MLDVVVGEGGLAAALSVPDDALALTCFNVVLDRFGRENLRVAHDVLLRATFISKVGDAVAQEEGQALTTEKGCAEAIGWGVRIFIGGILGGMLDRKQVGILEDEVFVERH